MALTKRYVYRDSRAPTRRSRARVNILSKRARDATFTDTPRPGAPECQNNIRPRAFSVPRQCFFTKRYKYRHAGRGPHSKNKHFHAKGRAVLEPHAQRAKRDKYRYAGARLGAHQTLRLPTFMGATSPFSSQNHNFETARQTLQIPTRGTRSWRSQNATFTDIHGGSPAVLERVSTF